MRLASVLNGISDAFIQELLHGQTMMSKLTLAFHFLLGLFSLYYYRHDLLQEEQTKPAATHHLRAAELARNLRRMPPVFWLTTCFPGAVTLQVGKEMFVPVMRQVLRLFFRWGPLAMPLTIATMASRNSIHDSVERLHPDAARVLSTSWHNLQVFTRHVYGSVFSQLHGSLATRASHLVAGRENAHAETQQWKATAGEARTGEAADLQPEQFIKAESQSGRSGPVFRGDEREM